MDLNYIEADVKQACYLSLNFFRSGLASDIFILERSKKAEKAALDSVR